MANSYRGRVKLAPFSLWAAPNTGGILSFKIHDNMWPYMGNCKILLYHSVRFHRESLSLHTCLYRVWVHVMDKNVESDCSLSIIKDLEGKREYKRSGQVPKLSECNMSQPPIVWISVYPCKSEQAFHQRIFWFAVFQNVISAGQTMSSFAAANTYSLLSF